MVDDRADGAFDERAALDELERFRQEIQREQARRRAVSDEFEAFIRSFKEPAKAPAPPPAALPPLPARPPIAPRAPEPPRIELPRTPVPPAPEPAPAPAPAPGARRRPALIAPLLALVLVGAGAAWWILRPAAPVSPPDAAAAVSPGQATPPATPPAADATPAPGAGEPAPAPAAPPPVPAAELTTTRNVWVRVIVDGERVLERELAADSRIPLTPTRTIVIRTGDAGAVRLTIGGKDQGILGREGQVVTRTFTVPDR